MNVAHQMGDQDQGLAAREPVRVGKRRAGVPQHADTLLENMHDIVFVGAERGRGITRFLNGNIGVMIGLVLWIGFYVTPHLIVVPIRAIALRAIGPDGVFFQIAVLQQRFHLLPRGRSHQYFIGDRADRPMTVHAPGKRLGWCHRQRHNSANDEKDSHSPCLRSDGTSRAPPALTLTRGFQSCKPARRPAAGNHRPGVIRNPPCPISLL